MIELDYPRERMLSEIRARGDVPPRTDLSDPRALDEFVAAEQGHLLLRVKTPEELLPALDAALARRFSSVPVESLQRNLLRPLKKALGNAHKRGNQSDPEKWIRVEVLATPAGAFVEIADEGRGFDVAETYARFRSGEHYFAHKGSGFRRYAQASALISFGDGGSTFRARFLAPGG